MWQNDLQPDGRGKGEVGRNVKAFSSFVCISNTTASGRRNIDTEQKQTLPGKVVEKITMSEVEGRGELQRAIEEFLSYLSDRVPPLMVADSIELLIKHPPEITGNSINSWIAHQHRGDPSISKADYLYHAVMKIQLMQEYKLIPPEDLHPFLNQLKNVVLSLCPPDQRPALKQHLEAIGKIVINNTVPQAEAIFRPKIEESAKTSQKSGGIKKSEMSRFAHLVRRLEKRLGSIRMSPDTASINQSEIVSEALIEAARTASEEVELNRLLEHLRTIGIQAEPDDVFVALGRNLPGWSIPKEGDVDLPDNSNLQAMHRLIAKSADAREAGNRFHLLVKAAIDHFNSGSLAQAASMIQLATKLIDSKVVEKGAVDTIRARIHEMMDSDRLKKYADTPAEHALLRKVLNFFPALTPTRLLQTLRTEQRREQRRLLLQILESHGEPTRTAVIEQLKYSIPQNIGIEETYFRRNLLYLLRRIPPAPDEASDIVADTVLPHADFSLPSVLVKEAVASLGQIKQEKAVQALVRLLHEAESLLLSPSGSAYDPEEILPSLDRIVAALCRTGTTAGRRAVIEHALKKKSQLGNTMSRLAEFSNHDLSDDQETVNRLLQILKQNLPLKRFGLVLHQRDQNALHVVEALSGTLLPGVRGVLEELASQYPGLPSGIAAARALTKQEQTIASRRTTHDVNAPSLTGDLDLFGLPSLLQNLGDSKVTGTLVLKQPPGEVFATLWMEKGELVSCRYGNISSDTAFFQLFEKPQTGTFEFIRSSEIPEQTKTSIGEILPLMLEAMRRYDEVQQLRPIVPENARLHAKSSQPTPLPDERDGLFFRDLWTLASTGSTAAECEVALSQDSYRVYRLLAHWIESGVLEVA